MRATNILLAGRTFVVAGYGHVLGERVVDRDHREPERAVALQGLEPDHAGRRLLGRADDVAQLLAPVRVEHADHVGAVVHRQLRLVVDRGFDVLVVGVVVLALDRKDGDLELVDERGRDVVLRRERVRGAEHDVRAAILQRAHQVGGLAGDVQAGGDAVARERLVGRETLADRSQDRHLPVGPLDPVDAFRREREILDVVPNRRSHVAPSFLDLGGEQPLVLALLPVERAQFCPCEPRVDRRSQVWLAPEARGER